LYCSAKTIDKYKVFVYNIRIFILIGGFITPNV